MGVFTKIGGSVSFTFRRRARVTTVSALAVAALTLTACTGGDGSPEPVDAATLDAGFQTSVDEAVEAAMGQSGSTGAIVGVWDGEEGEYIRGYGEGVDGGTQFRGAQATQPVMCALLLNLAADGKIELDRNVNEDLNRQVGIENVTYRQLCENTSGIADFKGSFKDIFVNNPTRPWSSRELLAEALVKSPLEWPGLDFHQADTNTLLLARALEVQQAQPIENLLENRVFDAANMSDTFYPDLETVTLDGGLVGHTYPASGGKPVCDVEAPTEITEVSPSMLGGAGATVTTVTDLKNFYSSFLGGAFGADEDADVLAGAFPTKNPERDEDGTPVEEAAAEDEEAAEGEEAAPEVDPKARMWAFGAEKVGPLYGRSGAITGTMTSVYQDPESGYTVAVVLDNSSAGAGFVKALTLQIAALSADAGIAPEVHWTAEDQVAKLAESAVCQ